MDLITLQNQLKVAIQNHQITVAKMKGEPQNTGLQKQLHDLQVEIMSLSEKQKQVVQQLRKDLEDKQGTGHVISPSATVASRLLLSAAAAAAQPALQAHRPTINVPPTPLGTSNKSPPSSGSVTATFASSPAAQHIIRQVVPSLVNNLVAAATGNVAFKTPIAAAVLLPSATTNAVFATKATTNTSAKGAENKSPGIGPHQAPLLVVPSPALRSSEAPSPSNLLVNFAPPIRVPQYPPPVTKPPTQQSLTSSQSISPASTTSPDVKERKPLLSTHNKSCSNKVSSTTPTRTVPKQEGEEQKMSFLGSLGLLSKTSLTEIQTKRVERKRRTTANPHFSNAAVEERRRHAAATALLQQAIAPEHHYHHHNRFHGPFKRPRGRPRLTQTPGSSRPSTPESPGTPSPPALATLLQTPPEHSPSISLLPLASISPPSNVKVLTSLVIPPVSPLNNVLTLSGLPHLLNGCLKPLAIRNGVAGERSCIICGLLVLMRLPTDGASCQQCKSLAHAHCIAVGSKKSPYYPGKPWTCQKCTKEILIVKEEDRQRLLKRRQELTTEQGHLKEKLKQLGQVAIGQQKRHKEMMSFQQRTQGDIKRIVDVVRMVHISDPPVTENRTSKVEEVDSTS